MPPDPGVIPELDPPSGSRAEASYDVTANDRANRRAGLPDAIFCVVLGALAMGGAGWLVGEGITSRLYVGSLLVSLLLFAGGAVLLVIAGRTAGRRLERVEVHRGGLRFVNAATGGRWFPWAGGPWRLTVYDYRGRDPAGRLWVTVPCTVSGRSVGGGLSGDAADAVERAARRAGLEVSVRENRIVRRLTIRAP